MVVIILRRSDFYNDSRKLHTTNDSLNKIIASSFSSSEEQDPRDKTKVFDLISKTDYSLSIDQESNSRVLNDTCNEILRSFYGYSKYWNDLLETDIKTNNYETLTIIMRKAPAETLEVLLYLSSYIKSIYNTIYNNEDLVITYENISQLWTASSMLNRYNFNNVIITSFDFAQKNYDKLISSNPGNNRESFLYNELNFKILKEIELFNFTDVKKHLSSFIDTDHIDNLKSINFLTTFVDSYVKYVAKNPESGSTFLPQDTKPYNYDDFPIHNILSKLSHYNLTKTFVPEYYHFPGDLKTISSENEDGELTEETIVESEDGTYSYDSLVELSTILNIITIDKTKLEILNNFSTSLEMSFADLEYIEQAENLDYQQKDNYVFDKNQEEFEDPGNVDNNFSVAFQRTIETDKNETELRGSYLNYVKSGDEDVHAILKERQKLVIKQKELREKIEYQEKYIGQALGKNTKPGQWNALSETFQAFYAILIHGEEQRVADLEYILEDLESRHKDALFSVDFCNMVYLFLYAGFQLAPGKEFGMENILNEQKYQEYKEELSGVKAIPGWIEINEIRHRNWDPILENLDNSGWKAYSCFYNYAIEEPNPFSGFLKDDGFNEMQELAIKGKKRLLAGLDDDIMKKITDAFYGPQESFNGHSIWTFTNILADLFAELEKPEEIDLLTSCSTSLLDFMKSAAYEMTSTVLLELLISLFNAGAVKIGGADTSLLSVYNNVLITKKMFDIMELSKDPTINSLVLAQEIEGLKTIILDTDNNPNGIGAHLERSAYFSKDGLNGLSSAHQESLRLLGGYEIGLEELEDDLMQFKPGDKGDPTGIWNLFEFNIQTWYLCTVYSQIKLSLNATAKVVFHEYSVLSADLRTTPDTQKQYAFLCGIKNRVDFIADEINKGVLRGIVKKGKISEDDLSNYFPNSTSNKTWDYAAGWTALMRENPELLNFGNHESYKMFLNVSERGLGYFSSAALTNRRAIEDLLLNKENSAITDTIGRILPTTSLLVNNFNIPLGDYLNRILEWFDELIILALSMIKRISRDNQLRINERYTREKFLLLNTNWELRVRSFSTVLDIIYSNISSLGFCVSTGTLGEQSATFEAITEVKDRLEQIDKSINPRDPQSPIDENARPISDTPPQFGNTKPVNPIDDDTLQKIEDGLNDKIITIPGGDYNNGIIQTPIIIIPKDELLDKDLDEIIDSITTPIVIIPGDKELGDHLEKPGSSIIIIDRGDYGDKLKDLLVPSDSLIEKEAQKQITDSYIKRDLDNIFNNITPGNPNFKPGQEAVERLNEIKDGFIFDDSKHLTTIDFSKINSKLFLNTLQNFNFQDFVNFKYSTLKMFKKF